MRGSGQTSREVGIQQVLAPPATYGCVEGIKGCGDVVPLAWDELVRCDSWARSSGRLRVVPGYS